MLRKLLFLAFALGLMAKVNAQNFNFGLHLTPTFNYLSSDDPAAEANLRLMFGLGLLAEYQFSENYSFASGVDIYFRRGGSMEKLDTTGNYGGSFINIPIALKLRTREFGYFTYYGRFGADISIETDEKTTFEPEPANRLSSYVDPLNIIFRVGAGAEYALGGSTKLFGEISYNRSLSDDLNESSRYVEGQYSYRFDYVALSVGVLF